MKVYVLIGLHEGKFAYMRVFGTRESAEELQQRFIDFDNEKNEKDWHYIINEEPIFN